MDRKRTAYHEAGHAVIAVELGLPVHKATIAPAEQYLGFVQHGLADGQTDYEGASGLAEAVAAVAGSPVVEEALRHAEQAYDEETVLFYIEPVRQALTAFEAVANSPALYRAVESKLTELVYESRVMVAMAGEAAECVLGGRDVPDWTRGARGDREGISGALVDLGDRTSVAVYVGGARETPYSSAHYFDYLWARTLMQVRASWPVVEAVAAKLLERETLSGDELEAEIKRVQRGAEGVR